MKKFKTIIIGGAAAGMGVASKLRRNDLNHDITIYQKSNYVSLGACGIPYYVANEFSNSETLLVRKVEDFVKQNINLNINHLVTDVNFREKKIKILNLQNNKEFFDSYDNLVIAVGAKPITIKNNLNLKNIFTAVSYEDAINIKKAAINAEKVIIIGGGFIGLEFAETFYHLKKNVIIIEGDNRVNSRAFDEQITNLIENHLEEKKIKLIKSKFVNGFYGEKDVEGVILNNGTKISGDLVINAIGFKPNTEFLHTTELFFFDNKAIIINEKGETNIKNVYSLGDCATVNSFFNNKKDYIPLATTAAKLAKVIANNISNIDDILPATLGTSAIRIIDLQVARTGLTYEQAENMFPNSVNTVFIKDYDRTNYVKSQKELYLKLIYHKDSKLLLGAQIAGYDNAILRINALSVAIFNKLNLDDLTKLDLIYAPPFSKTNDIIHIAAAKGAK